MNPAHKDAIRAVEVARAELVAATNVVTSAWATWGCAVEAQRRIAERLTALERELRAIEQREAPAEIRVDFEVKP